MNKLHQSRLSFKIWLFHKHAHGWVDARGQGELKQCPGVVEPARSLLYYDMVTSMIYLGILSHLCVCVSPSVVSFATLWTVVHQAPLSFGILQARILELVATSSSRASSWPRDGTCVSYISCIGGWLLYPPSHLGSSKSSVAVPGRRW